MNDEAADGSPASIELEFELDEPPQQVWRAISVSELRERWLPAAVLAETDAVSLTPGEEVSYKMRDPDAPFLESLVTFRIRPNAAGGTRLRIIHGLTDQRFARLMTRAANLSAPALRAA